MDPSGEHRWRHLTVPLDKALERITPGMNIFIGTGSAEPRTLLRRLLSTDLQNTRDLELVQISNYGDTLSLEELRSNRYRLKTFFSGWVSPETIASGRVDLISGRFSQRTHMFATGRIPVDAAFIQITPPNRAGYCSLGIAIDAAREVIERASLVIGEINPAIPFTFGDTVIVPADFDHLVEATEAPIYIHRQRVHPIWQRVAANLAMAIRDGDCINFAAGPLFDALTGHLVHKRHLGIHSLYITDAVMELHESGAVTNYRKAFFRGKSAVSYALGSSRLMAWLDRNPLVEFQRIDLICNPLQIARNPSFKALLQARKVDLLGGVAFPIGTGPVVAGPGSAVDLVSGAELSEGGRSIFALTSRDEDGAPNILVSLKDERNQFRLRDAVNTVVTEYGVANLKWRTIRERAQALIDVAHPDDREALVREARRMRILYPDQIYLAGAGRMYPLEVQAEATFKGGVRVHFRAIKPSDEEPMRRLFYRFSDETVYYRYLFPIKTMPHHRVQEYVNVDFRRTMSVVGLVGEADTERLVAEARFEQDEESGYADVGFVVDEDYQGLGIAGYLFVMLRRLARERGLRGFTAEVLASNAAMLKVFRKHADALTVEQLGEVCRLTMPFETPAEPAGGE